MTTRTKQIKGAFGALKIIEPKIVAPLIDEEILHDPVDAPTLKECCNIIAKSYVIVANATDCWLRMGFALIRAKTLIKHGHFIQWRNETFPSFKKSHLSNAMLVCQRLIAQRTSTCIEDLIAFKWDELVEEIIDACKEETQSGLLMSVTQPRQLPNEEKYKKQVEGHFIANPEYSDRWLPLIETGEYTWSQVAQAINGIKNSTAEDGSRKQSAAPVQLFFDSLHLSAHRIKKIDWTTASFLEIDPIKRELGDLIANIPATVLADLSPEAKQRLVEVANALK